MDSGAGVVSLDVESATEGDSVEADGVSTAILVDSKQVLPSQVFGEEIVYSLEDVLSEYTLQGYGAMSNYPICLINHPRRVLVADEVVKIVEGVCAARNEESFEFVLAPDGTFTIRHIASPSKETQSELSRTSAFGFERVPPIRANLFIPRSISTERNEIHRQGFWGL